MKVRNLTNDDNRAIANQFVIHDNGKCYFQSYASLIGEWDGETLTLGCDWDYSVTTLKHLYRWIDEYCYTINRRMDEITGAKSKADRIRRAIDAGIILYNPNMQ